MSEQASLGSSSQAESSIEDDWQEEVYQKIKSMNEMHFHELNELYQRMASKLQQHEAISQHLKSEQYKQLRFLKLMVERFITFLRTDKHEVQTHHKDKIVVVERQMVNILIASREEWKEEVYRKIQSMNVKYSHDLNALYQRIVAKLQEHEDAPQQPKNEQLEELRFLRVWLKHFIIFLLTDKNEVRIHHKKEIDNVERVIVNILHSNRPRRS